ncbi:hypothetical protein CEXT_134731 [Caerostris extrusa]|uniref:Uncharacterized protein n=1 Tax=Caerostris extrusa TaxID=172846 RepID=A0AAV4WER0_CAEEX|nr:hypothetical protein CEXT_134731 [Caerostris extrusa]
MYRRPKSKTDTSLMKGGRRPRYLLFFVLLSGADEIGSQDADGIYRRTKSRTKRKKKNSIMKQLKMLSLCVMQLNSSTDDF